VDAKLTPEYLFELARWGLVVQGVALVLVGSSLIAFAQWLECTREIALNTRYLLPEEDRPSGRHRGLAFAALLLAGFGLVALTFGGVMIVFDVLRNKPWA
jgi:hypothetical protein